MKLGLGLSLVTRAPAEDPGDGLGPERVVNGGFDTATDWSGTQWSISGGTANCATSFVRVFNNSAGATAEIGKTYRCTFTIVSISAGTVALNYSASGTARSAPGTYTEDLTASDGSIPLLRATSGTTASVDNVSIKEVLAP